MYKTLSTLVLLSALTSGQAVANSETTSGQHATKAAQDLVQQYRSQRAICGQAQSIEIKQSCFKTLAALHDSYLDAKAQLDTPYVASTRTSALLR